MKTNTINCRILSVILCALMMVSLIPVSAVADTGSVPGFALTADKTELYSGETLKVTLNLNCGSSGVTIFQTALTYDTDRLELQSAEVTEAFSGYSPTVNSGNPGIIYLNWDAVNALTGTIGLLSMEFIPKAGATGTAAVGFSETEECIMADSSFNEIDFQELPCSVILKEGERPEDEPEDSEEITSLTLDKSYIMMQTGCEQTATVTAVTIPEKYIDELSWGLTDDSVVRVTKKDNVCTITPLTAGTAFLTASATDSTGKKLSASCRIDVVQQQAEQEIQASLTLKSTSAAVELYSTDYAKIEVLPVFYQGNNPESVSAAENGLAIQSAKFTDSKLSDYFDLAVVDDHTLEIQPKASAVKFGLAKSSNLKGNFTSTIEAVIGGKTVTTSAKIKVTVKKTLPAIKCAAVKFNSYTGTDRTSGFTFTVSNKPAQLKNLALNTKIAKPLPDWLSFDSKNQELTYEGADKKSMSGKVYLTGTLSGWVDEVANVALIVSVSASSTAPKISFKPSSVTLGSNSGDKAEIACTVSTLGFDTEDIYIQKLTEGSGKKLVSSNYGEEEFNNRLNAVLKDGILKLSSNDKTGKSSSYKLYIGLADKVFTLNVKTALPTMTVKASGTIDTILEGCPITVTPTFKNISDLNCVQCYDYKVTTSDKSAADVTDKFAFNQETMQLTANKSNMPAKGTYLLTLSADVGGSNLITAKSVKFTVKTSTKKPAASVAFKVSGTIDVLRAGTSSVLTPTIKNCYTVKLNSDSICFYSLANKVYSKIDNPGFNIEQSSDGKTFTLSSNGNLKAGKYYLGLTKEKYDEIGITKPTYATVTVKQGSASVKFNPSSVTLSKTDRYDYKFLSVYTTDKTLGNITDVKLASGSNMFRIESYDTGRWILGYSDQSGTPTIADSITKGKTKTATVKLSVYFEGSETPVAANLKISIK